MNHNIHHKGHILYLYETATGLGHQRRASGIVNQLFEDGFDVTVASGSFVKPEEYFHSGINLIHLPTNRKNMGGKFYYYDEHNNLVLDENFNLNSWKTKRKKAIEDIARHKKIDALIPEWWPFKRINEFSGVVQQIEECQERHFGQKPLLFSSIRDVLSRVDLDEPDNDNDKARRAVEILNSRVTAVLVHGDPHLVTFPETFALADDIKIPLFYTGYVVRDADEPTGSKDRSKRVIISSGSGDLGHHVLNAAYGARSRTDIALHDWTYVLGPRIGESRDKLHCLRKAFKPEAQGIYQVPHDECIEDTSDLPQWFRHAAFSISNAGYNTTMEVLSSGVPAVLTAKTKRDGDFDKEQWSRLLRLQSRGMATIAHPDETRNPQVFAQIINRAFQAGSPTVSLDFGGARETSRIIDEFLRAHRSSGPVIWLPAHTAVPTVAEQSMPYAPHTAEQEQRLAL